MKQSLQDKYAPGSICFGCGPANKSGLQLKSFVDDDGENSLVCHWVPREKYQAFPGILNGGIIGSLLDCHSNWTAANFLMQKNGWVKPHCTVTAFYNVSLKRPTPISNPLLLRAWVFELKNDRALIKAALYSKKILCASLEGLFVAVKKSHPAFHRWD